MKCPIGPEQGSAEDPQWEPCSPGVLHEAAATAPSIHRRALLKLIAGGTVLTAVGGGVAIGLSQAESQTKSNKPGGNPFLGGIACISVLDQMPNYLNGKLDDQITERMTSHLIDCPDCRREYTQLCCNSDPGCVSRPSKPQFKMTPCSLR